MTYGKANFGYGDEYKIDRVSKILITIDRVSDDQVFVDVDHMVKEHLGVEVLR
jgi:hypothetical protein